MPQNIDIGRRKQVFIDGRYLQDNENCRIVVCPPKKTGETCLIGELRGYGNIMPVDGAFCGFDALSKDGRHWRRVEHGTRPESDDVVGYRNGMPVVFRDPTAPPEARYKLANPKQGWVKASADGDVNVKDRMKPVLSRVVLRKDGFTAVTADYAGGEFTTPPLDFDGSTLHLNVNTSATGILRVGIQDDGGSFVPGYSLEDCDRIHTANTIDRVVSWSGGETDTSDLQSRPVKLRFELRYGAKLYAFGFGPLDQ